MKNSVVSLGTFAAACFLLSACAQLEEQFAAQPLESPTTSSEVVVAPIETSLRSEIPDAKINTPVRAKAAEALAALDKGDLNNASILINQALKMDIQNSYLQFLNAYIYHRRAVAGDSQAYALAMEGYRLAVEFDASNSLALYHLGLLHIDQKQYLSATEVLAKAVYFTPNDTEALYQLSKAAYYAGDPAIAKTALSRLIAIDPAAMSDSRVLRGLVMSHAAAGEDKIAADYLTQLAGTDDGPYLAPRLEQRVDQWSRFHATIGKGGGKVQLAQSYEELLNAAQDDAGVDEMNIMVDVDEVEAGFGDDGGNPFNAPGGNQDEFTENEMVVVDVVIIGTEEDVTNSVGVNLLTGLSLQFGNPFTGERAFDYSRSKTRDFETGFGSAWTRTITHSLGIPAITYSLNIANALRAENQILAKPTLVALSGETSQFFSGVDVDAAATSTAGRPVIVQKEVGVKMEITPEILPQNKIRLQVLAERTFLTQPSPSVVFDHRLDVTKTAVNATVALEFGQTLILSGLSEREIEDNSDGVPGLQDVPILQYAFSRESKRSFDKSVLILLTPRKPQFATQTAEDIAQAAAEGDLSSETVNSAIDKLAARDGDWFKPDPTINEIFRKLDSSVLYEEFRQGDFAIEDWESKRENRNRLSATINWLYF